MLVLEPIGIQTVRWKGASAAVKFYSFTRWCPAQNFRHGDHKSANKKELKKFAVIHQRFCKVEMENKQRDEAIIFAKSKMFFLYEKNLKGYLK
jgi:hypothetical protein